MTVLGLVFAKRPPCYLVGSMNILQMTKRIFLLLVVNILVMTTITMVLGLLARAIICRRAAWRGWRSFAWCGASAAPSFPWGSRGSWPNG